MRQLWVLLLCSAASCDAAELELSLGVTHFTPQSNGIWYQEGFNYKLGLTSPAVGVKLLTDAIQTGWQFGLGYLYAGRATSTAIAVASDTNYNDVTHGCNGKCWPMSHWYGSGRAQGISLTARKNLGSWYVEGGVMASRNTYAVHIPDWIACATCSPQNVTSIQPTSVKLSPVASVGYRRGDWSVGITAVPTHMQDGSYGIYKGASPSVAVNYRISF